jgi:ribosomal peptide maturation radical SAM protein 1
MPWNLLETPSLPLGLMQAKIRECGNGDTTTGYYGNLRWAEYLYTSSGGAVTPDDYGYIANWGIWHGMGDWVFAGALHGSPDWQAEQYAAYLVSRSVDPGKSPAMRELAAGFVDMAAAEILATDPDVVGFSSTFQQNVPSLAVARALKHARPALPIVFGGGNCDGGMGAALHAEFECIDYVVSGEGELAFPALLNALRGKRALTDVPGLCWRADDGSTISNGTAPMVPMTAVPLPDYGDWFAALDQSQVRDYVRPLLLFEASRGCWWGEKHQCTFCGLNGTTMQFRSRDPDQAWQGLAALVSAHQVLDVVLVDNILGTRYIREVLPRIATARWDLRIYCEVKANLRHNQLASFSEAGASHIQPGIENLSTRVLTPMDKGVHATQNVQVMRDCEEHQLTVDWNYLYGFPGEADDDYTTIIEQLPALVHLHPPSGASRIILERFSPYFERPELGFTQRRPAEFYKYIYDMSEERLAELIYQFDTPRRGITGKVEDMLCDAVAAWRGRYLGSSLVVRGGDGCAYVHDAREGWPERVLVLDGPVWPAAYRLLRTSRTISGLVRALAAEDIAAEAEEVAAWLGWAGSAGLVFCDSGRAVALATSRVPVRPERP